MFKMHRYLSILGLCVAWGEERYFGLDKSVEGKINSLNKMKLNITRWKMAHEPGQQCIYPTWGFTRNTPVVEQDIATIILLKNHCSVYCAEVINLILPAQRGNFH